MRLSFFGLLTTELAGRRRARIDETNDGPVRKARILRKTDLASATRRIPVSASRRYCRLEVAQRVLVELRSIESLVARETAAQHVVDLDDFAAASSCNRRELIDDSHLAHAAHGVNRYGQ